MQHLLLAHGPQAVLIFGPSYLAFFIHINADMNAWPKIVSVQSYIWATYQIHIICMCSNIRYIFNIDNATCPCVMLYVNCRFDTFWNAKMHEIITCVTSSSSCVLNYRCVFPHRDSSHSQFLAENHSTCTWFKLLIHLALEVSCFFHTVFSLPSVLIFSSVCAGGKSEVHMQESSWTNRRKHLEQWGNKYRFHVKCVLTLFCFNCFFSSWIELMAREEQLLFISLYFLLHGDTFTTKPHH